MKKGRSSIITIIIVLIIIGLVAYGIIRYIEKNSKTEEVVEPAYEYTNFQEEDFMQYEYSKMDKSLEGMYALAIEQDYIVGVKSYNDTVKLFQIDPEKEYSYAYYDAKLYIVQNDTGTLNILDLNTLELSQEEIVLKPNIIEIAVSNNGLYFISENSYNKYTNDEVEEIYNNVTSNEFVIKGDNLYICLDKIFYKIDEEGNKTKIDQNVENIYYNNFYERDKIIYDKLIDDEATSKNLYNIYTENTYSSIRNNTYFVAYDANKYIYTTQDNTKVVLLKENNTNKYLYKCKTEEQINDVTLFKEGYIIVSTNRRNAVIDLDAMNELISDNIIYLQKIKYLK